MKRLLLLKIPQSNLWITPIHFVTIYNTLIDKYHEKFAGNLAPEFHPKNQLGDSHSCGWSLGATSEYELTSGLECVILTYNQVQTFILSL